MTKWHVSADKRKKDRKMRENVYMGMFIYLFFLLFYEVDSPLKMCHSYCVEKMTSQGLYGFKSMTYHASLPQALNHTFV